jgi:hypothetical protein
MRWRWGWPPWVSARIRADRQNALDAIERATIDLSETKASIRRTAKIADSLSAARRHNHFSESMEALFAARARATRTAHHPKG